LSPDPHSSTTPRLIETEIGDSDAPLAPATYAGLPDDLLRESARRLGIICLVAAAVWTVNLVLIHFVYAVPGTVTPEDVASYRQRLAVYDLVGGFNVVLALSLSWTWRWATRCSSPCRSECWITPSGDRPRACPGSR
jgi:hypothetical protein